MRLLHPSAYKNARDPFPTFRGIVDEVGLKKGVERLIADGSLVHPHFKATFDFLADKAGASKATIKVVETIRGQKTKAHEVDRGATSCAPVKGEARIIEKAKYDFRDVQPPYAAVTDVVRGTMAFDGPRGIVQALDVVKQWDSRSTGSSAVFRVAQVRDLYSKSFRSHYGDVKVMMLFFVNGVPDGHVCELQLNTVDMLAAKEGWGGHASYEADRVFPVTWFDEHGRDAPSLEDVEEDYARFRSEPESHAELAAKYAGAGRSGKEGATVADYYDLLTPILVVAERTYRAPRQSFDDSPASQLLAERVKAMAAPVAARWDDHFGNQAAWAKLD